MNWTLQYKVQTFKSLYFNFVTLIILRGTWDWNNA